MLEKPPAIAVPKKNAQEHSLVQSIEDAQRWLIKKLQEQDTIAPEICDVRSIHFAQENLMNYNDDFLDVMRPIVERQKILDIFAGSQKTREFYDREGVSIDVTSVDINPGRADFSIDVAKIVEYIPPAKQFRAIFSFGYHPGFVKYEDIGALLDDEGYFVTGSSEGQFVKYELPLFGAEGPQQDGPYAEEMEKIKAYFYPVVAIRVHGAKDWFSEKKAKEKGVIDKGMDRAYVLWKKNNVVMPIWQ